MLNKTKDDFHQSGSLNKMKTNHCRVKLQLSCKSDKVGQKYQTQTWQESNGVIQTCNTVFGRRGCSSIAKVQTLESVREIYTCLSASITPCKSFRGRGQDKI